MAGPVIAEIVKPAKRAPLVLAIFNRRLHS
jgi:hypothetical protein